jgi:hypothetical protein
MGGREWARGHLDSTVILVLTEKTFRGRPKFVVSERAEEDEPTTRFVYKINIIKFKH